MADLDAGRVIPAQLDFLAIYNPTLSQSDESLKDQIVYYYSRRSRKRDRDSNGSGSESDHESNERLRQIGLAQGMVNFAKTFSEHNVDTIETDKSRIVLHELEQDWWVLASIDLTRLPAKATDGKSSTSSEYSAREVSPAPLLITQLARANALFLLHHSIKLSDLFQKVGRDTFCGLLERYWNKFVRNWDVLLHGNPACTIYNATKLSGAGELGIGVGEEEWGSGEREVLEDFIDRTEGLRELVVGRYGLPPKAERSQRLPDQKLEWLGNGNDVAAADGVIFSGKGLISRKSLRTVSQWMEAIFKYGEDAYGVSDNPSARPRAQRKRQKTDRSFSDQKKKATSSQQPTAKSPQNKAPDLRKRAMANNATPTGIPPPLVNSAEASSAEVSAQAKFRTKSKSPDHKTAASKDSEIKNDDGSSTFGADNMMRYLTLGYGTSWTLNPKGLKTNGDQKPETPSKKSDTSGNTTSPANTSKATIHSAEPSRLQEIEPSPEVVEDEIPFKQKLDQTIGEFIIGLSGDLEQTELDSGGSDNDASQNNTGYRRLFLRTLNVEMAVPKQQQRNPTIRQSSSDSVNSRASKRSTSSDPKTSASASIDGSRPHIVHEKVQVAVYVHQPFIFVFLFELHTPNLTMPAFYRSIHNQLGPLQKPLLQSTDPTKIAARIADAMNEKSTTSPQDTTSQAGNSIHDLLYDGTKLTVRTSIPNIPVPGSFAAEGLASSASSAISISGSWYTLGIPIGTVNEGVTQDTLVKSPWSRTEALNVHTQVLNTYIATRSGKEAEHTAKTARGWWVLWMKIPLSLSEVNTKKNTPARSEYERSFSISTVSSLGSNSKEALLVRKAEDFQPPRPAQSRNLSSGPGRWLLREQKREVSGASSAGGVVSARGVSDGVGVDAKRYIEGLLTLTQ